MELQIQDLVSSIRKDGVEAAQRESEQIISAAQEKAKEIVSQARAQAEKAVEDASREIAILRQSAHVSAQQAKRDAMLSLKKEVNDIYGQLLVRNVSKALSSDKELALLIRAAVTGQDASALSVEVSKVTDHLKAELAEELEKGLVLRPASDIDAGFRVVSSDGSGYFDCTDEELSAMISHFLGEISI